MTKFLSNHIAVSKYKGVDALVTFKNAADRLDTSVTKVTVDVKDTTGEIASWGKQNNYPQEAIKAVKLNGSASSGLRFLRKAHYGNGLVLYKDEVENGKHKPKLIPISEDETINTFFMNSQIQRFTKEIILDLEWWSLAFPEYILSNNYETINKVSRQKTAWCRFELMNETNGLVEHVYISEGFGKRSVDLTGDYVEKVPLIDSYWSPEQVKAYCKANKITKFIRPVFYPLLDEAFYPEPEWQSILKSGWLDVANSVPALKKALFNNQMTIKYIIEIDERYFEKIYQGEWNQFKPDERKKIRQDVIDSINEGLVGNDKAGKTIQSMMLTGSDNKQYSAIKITALDDKLKDGSYLPEAEAANSEVLFALGVDPTLIGAGIPGGSLGAGSGSDKREAFIILSALKKTDRETTLEIFQFIQQYNKWDPKIRFAFENTILKTLDANPTGTENAL